MPSQKALQHLRSALHAFGGIQQRDRGAIQQRDREEDWEKNWNQQAGNFVMTPEALWNMPFDRSITGPRIYHVQPQTLGTYSIYVRRTDQAGEHPWIRSTYHLEVTQQLKKLFWNFRNSGSTNQEDIGRVIYIAPVRFVLCSYALRHNEEPNQMSSIVKKMDVLHELPLSDNARISAFRHKQLRRFITASLKEIKDYYYWIADPVPIAYQIYLRDNEFGT